jgi:hypothetical protein
MNNTWNSFYICPECGHKDSGIIDVSTHWVNCTGKKFHDNLIKEREKGNPLTIEKIEELKTKYL